MWEDLLNTRGGHDGLQPSGCDWLATPSRTKGVWVPGE